jgi:hypothetical protein
MTCGEPLEDLELQAERAVAGIGDLGFDLAEFGRRKTYLAGQRLAMDEGGVERRHHQLVAVLRRDLDEIAEHIVVADLKAFDAGRFGVARLQRRHHAARFVAQIAASRRGRVIALCARNPPSRLRAGNSSASAAEVRRPACRPGGAGLHRLRRFQPGSL